MTLDAILWHVQKAEQQAADWAKQPNGEGLAALRRRDAAWLREMGKAELSQAVPPANSRRMGSQLPKRLGRCRRDRRKRT